GGAAAARAAMSLLGREHEVTLIDRSAESYLCGSFPLLIVGEREREQAHRSLASLAGQGVKFLQAEVQEIDTSAKTVTTSSGKLEYDYLVVATGAVYDWGAVPGSGAAHSFYNLETAERLRRELGAFRKGRIIIAVSRLPYKCPPAPFEAAMMLEWMFNRWNVRSEVELHVFTPEPMPLAVAGPEAGQQLIGYMQRRGIQPHTGAAITEVSRDGREAVFSDGSAMEAGLIITVPVHEPPPLVREADLVGPSGWIDVNPQTMETSVPNVYAIGDVNQVPMANGRGIPKAGVFASSEGETVARNIAAKIRGEDPTKFPGVGYCFILYDGAQAGMVEGEFLASGRPNVTMRPPSVDGFRAKEQFEHDWRSFRI
ncbi:MAG: NAD(P)/FAD-dependent oxidoreductase, partial [Chloroflexi bacterium]|nr:NAD(P)/FAD-dependent oxidoreductase [Chloroflexota bacterium]